MAEASKASGLVYVVWEVTLKCDLACKHCGSRAGKPRAEELTTAEALDLVNQIGEMGAEEITLIGGEAYLRDDWADIASAIKERGMICSITTGGRGMTRERAALARAAGVDTVSVSIDGIGKTHDTQRGLTGSYEAAIEALANLSEAGISATVNTQVNRLSFPDLDQVLDLLIERKLHAWQVQLTVPMGRAADRPEWLLQPYELLEVTPKLAELAERGARSGVLMWPGNNVGYFGPHERTLRGRAIKRDRHFTGCTAGKHTLGIESDGAIKGCPSLPTTQYVGGHIRESSLSSIWQNASQLKYTRERTQDDLWGFCRTCYYAEVCMAGCTWTSHVFFGRPGNNPYCHHRALEHAKNGQRERLIRTQAAPGNPFDHGMFDILVEPLEQPPTEPKRRRLEVLR